MYDRYYQDGRVMEERDVYRSLKISTVASFVGMIWFPIAFGIPITMLMECLTENGVLIGMVVTLQQIAMLAQIPSALFFERLHSRKKLWGILAISHRVIWFLPVFIPWIFADVPLVAVTIMLISIAISALIAQVAGPMWQSWMADLIPQRIGGRFWGIRQSIVMVAFLLGTGFSGWILDKFPDPRHNGSYLGFSIVFTIAAVFGVADIVIHLFVAEPKPGIYRKQDHMLKRIVAPLKNLDFRWMTVSFALWYLALGLVGAFGIIYLRREFELTYTQLSFLAISASLGPILFGILHGFLIDRIGARTYCIILMITNPLLALVWFVLGKSMITLELPILGVIVMPKAMFILLITNFFGGALGGGIGICQMHLINVFSSRDGRGMAIAVHWTLVGIMSAIGPIIGGLVMDYYSQHPIMLKLPSGIGFSFFHVLMIFYIIIVLIICCVLMKVKVRTREMSIWEALNGLRVGNPLRAISIVYNVYQSGFEFERGKEEKDSESSHR